MELILIVAMILLIGAALWARTRSAGAAASTTSEVAATSDPVEQRSPTIGDRIKNVLWPDITDLQTARAVAKRGAWSAFFSTFALVVSILLKLIGPVCYFEAIVIGVLGVLIMRMSRAAAELSLLIFVVERVYGGVAHGMGAVIGAVPLVLLLGFIHGVRGTQAFHRFRVEQAASTAAPAIQ